MQHPKILHNEYILILGMYTTLTPELVLVSNHLSIKLFTLITFAHSIQLRHTMVYYGVLELLKRINQKKNGECKHIISADSVAFRCGYHRMLNLKLCALVLIPQVQFSETLPDVFHAWNPKSTMSEILKYKYQNSHYEHLIRKSRKGRPLPQGGLPAS